MPVPEPTTDDTSVPPPAYNATSVESRPVDPRVQDNVLPDYTPPTQFTIGGSKTPAPLVSIAQIKGHLALLHAFAELKKKVESTEFSLPNIPKEEDRKWAWFVALAVERCVLLLSLNMGALADMERSRFDRWCLALQPADSTASSDVAMPPVDVIMVRIMNSSLKMAPDHGLFVLYAGLARLHAEPKVRLAMYDFSSRNLICATKMVYGGHYADH